MIQAGDLDVRAPFPGESLDGFVADIVGANDLRKVRSISGAGGVAYGHRPQLATTGWNGLPALAELLEVAVEELQVRSYPLSSDDGSRRAFFGTTIHRTDLRTRERWFAPNALASSPHHRAMWQLKLPFDVVTGELLVSTCPRASCGRVQRWRHSAGTAWCDACVQDLSLQDVPRLGDDHLPNYSAAAGLTHTDPAKRTVSLGLLPEEIRAMGADMAYELLLRLVPVMNGECTWRTGSRLWANDPFDIARGMGQAWEAVKGWPHKVIEKMTSDIASSTSRHNDGNGGRSLAFLRLRAAGFVAEPVAAAIRDLHAMIDEDGPNGDRIKRETIGCTEVAHVTGISTSRVVALRRQGALRTIVVARGPLLAPVYDRGEIIDLDRDIRRRWDLRQGSLPLGLPYYALEQLCALGRLQRLHHPSFAVRYPEPQITEQAVLDFAAMIVAASSSIGSLGHTVPILSIVRMVGGRLKPWDAIIEAMLSGALPFEVRGSKGALFERIRVRRDDIRGLAALPITRPGTATALTIQMQPDFPFADHLTKRDAGEVLNLSVKQYTRHLRGYRTSSERVVPVEDVLRMAKDHVTNTEIAEQLAIAHQKVRFKAAELGVTRLSEAGYRRTLAERLLVPALMGQ